MEDCLDAGLIGLIRLFLIVTVNALIMYIIISNYSESLSKVLCIIIVFIVLFGGCFFHPMKQGPLQTGAPSKILSA